MEVSRRIKYAIVLSFILASTGLYLYAPFAFFPYMFSTKEHSAWDTIWVVCYAPVVRKLEPDNWYKSKFTAMTDRLCKEYPDRCGAPKSD